MTSWNGVKVLVTGGASFIGSHLVDRLVSRGAVVRVADDLSSGSLANLSQCIDRIEFLEGDLRDRMFTRGVTGGRDVVFHLAACHGGRGFIEEIATLDSSGANGDFERSIDTDAARSVVDNERYGYYLELRLPAPSATDRGLVLSRVRLGYAYASALPLLQRNDP